MSIKSKPAKFVRIIWFDAADVGAAWSRLDDEAVIEWMAELCSIISFGYLVGENKHYYILAADLCHDATVGRLTKIPRPWVTDFAVVKVTVKSKKGKKSKRGK